MREIKFRAFDDGKMIYHDKVNTILIENYDHLQHFFKSIRNDVIVMQYTGLKDKNGKEIYEGDTTKNRTYIKFDEELSLFTEFDIKRNIRLYYPIDINRIEIIGNIYENPELINK